MCWPQKTSPRSATVATATRPPRAAEDVLRSAAMGISINPIGRWTSSAKGTQGKRCLLLLDAGVGKEFASRIAGRARLGHALPLRCQRHRERAQGVWPGSAQLRAPAAPLQEGSVIGHWSLADQAMTNAEGSTHDDGEAGAVAYLNRRRSFRG